MYYTCMLNQNTYFSEPNLTRYMLNTEYATLLHCLRACRRPPYASSVLDYTTRKVTEYESSFDHAIYLRIDWQPCRMTIASLVCASRPPLSPAFIPVEALPKPVILSAIEPIGTNGDSKAQIQILDRHLRVPMLLIGRS